MDKSVLCVRDFTVTPGPRYRSDGPFSGEQFFEERLRPAFDAAVRDNCLLLVDLDGTAGYGSSFLEEAFGGLVRNFEEDLVRQHLQVKTEDEPYQEEEIWRYVAEAGELKRSEAGQ